MIVSDHMKGKTCLITGSTSGHGLAVAEALCAMGADIIIHGPTRESCEAVKGRFPSGIRSGFPLPCRPRG